MPVYFNVSVIHQTLTWTTVSLKCAYVIFLLLFSLFFFVHGHTHGGPLSIVSSKGIFYSLHRIWLRRNLREQVRSPAHNLHPCKWWPQMITLNLEGGVGIAQWLERRTRDWKVTSSNPCRSGGRIFFSKVDFLRWLLFWYLFHPHVTAVACKRSWSICQKCRWPVTACTLCM